MIVDNIEIGASVVKHKDSSPDNITFNTDGSIALASALPVASGGTGQTSFTNGQLLIGNSLGNTLTKATLTGTDNITITNSNGSITINTSQDLATDDSPTFADLTISSLTSTGVVYAGSGGDLETSASNFAYSSSLGTLQLTGVSGSIFNQLQISAVSGETQDASFALSAVGGTGLAKIDLFAGQGASPRSSRLRFFSGSDSVSTPQWHIANDYSSNGTFNLSFVDKGGVRVLELTQNEQVGIGGAPDEILHIIKASADNYIKVEAGGTSTNYAGIRFAERLLDYGHAIRMDAATDKLHFSSVDNTPTYTDHTEVTYGGNWSYSGTATFTGGVTGSSPSPQISMDDYFDNAGNPSISHFQLYTNYGFGISASQLNYFSDADHVFYDGTTELARITTNGYLEINNPSSNVYNLNVNGNAHFGSSYDASAYGTLVVTEALTRSNNKYAYSMVAAGNEIVGLGYLDGTTTMKLGRGSGTNDSRGLYNNSSNNWGIENSNPQARLHVHQTSTTAAIPVLELEQEDTDQAMINFNGNVASGTSTSISTNTTSGSTTHHIQIEINGTKAWIAASINNPT